MGNRVLLVGSNVQLLQALKFLFEMNGFIPETACTPSEAAALLDAQDSDIVLIDLNVGKEAGEEILAYLEAMKNPPPEVVIAMTSHLGEEQLGRIRALARKVIFKPIAFNELLEEIQMKCMTS